MEKGGSREEKGEEGGREEREENGGEERGREGSASNWNTPDTHTHIKNI